ncbi:MAG: DUF4303 domain-containing protein [Chloroflexi bacterium]|nr:DUF4303 domain-containing protein [Chloroflexota bacterium]
MTEFDLTIDFDFDGFEEEVYAAARAVFAKLQNDRSDELFYTFNFCTGDVTQDVVIYVNTEEELDRFARSELQRDDRYLDVPFEDFRTYWRYQPSSLMLIYGKSEAEFAKRFAKANDMLWALKSQIEEMEDELLDDDELDEDDYYEALFETVYEPIEERLKSVLRRLDNESAFEITNTRRNIHLGVMQSNWDYDMLPGPFEDINPTESCRRYEQDAAIFQRVNAIL